MARACLASLAIAFPACRGVFPFFPAFSVSCRPLHACHSKQPTQPPISYPCVAAGLGLTRTAAAAASQLLFAAAGGGHSAALRLAMCIAPEAMTAHDTLGAQPLHAASSGCHLEAMRVLLDAAPGSAAAADRHGCLPLHAAAAAVGTTGGTNLSHTAGPAVVSEAQAGVHAAAIRLLLAAAPQAVTVATLNGDFPLHLAAGATRWTKTSAAVAELLATAPSMAQEADQMERLPLHAAAQAAHAPTIQLLLAAFPAGAVARDRMGYCPLHDAAAVAGLEGAEAAVRFLLQAAPEAAAMPAPGGALPLELALGRSTIQAVGARQAVARALISAGPAIQVLQALRRAGPERGWPLLPDSIIARAH